MRTNKILLLALFILVFVSFISVIFAVDPVPSPGSSSPASGSSPSGTSVYGRYNPSVQGSVVVMTKTETGEGDTVEKGFEVSVFNIPPSAPPARLTDDELRALSEQYEGDPLGAMRVAMARFGVGHALNNNYESVPNANVKLEYQAGARWDPVPGCENLVTSDQKIDANGRDYYYKPCAVPQDLYDNVCTNFRATFVPTPEQNLRYAQQTSTICAEKIGGVDAFERGVSNLFDPTGLSTSDPRYWKYVGFAALLGMLLSGMYFSGKSPISLLDIAQPRLPGPKTFAAGGQILGPFGYTEMKKTTLDKMKATHAILARELENMLKNTRLSGGTKSLLASMTGSMKLNAIERNIGNEIERARTFANSLGALHAKNGGDLHSIRALLTKHVNDYSKAEHELLAKTLNDIERRGTAHDVMLAQQLKHQAEGSMLYRQLLTLTGVGVAPGTSGWLRSQVLGKTIGGGRYSVLSYTFPPIIDSAIRSVPIAGRWAKAAVAETGLFIANRFSGGRGFEKLAQYDQRLATDQSLVKKYFLGKAVHGLYEMLRTQHPDYIAVGGKAPIMQKMAHLYNTVEREAYSDLMRHVMKELYREYGIELEGIVSDPHGLLFVDLLERTGANHADVARLRAMEEELRRILGSRLESHEKLAELIQLARKEGTHLDGSVFRAQEGLNHLRASEIPEHIRLFELQAHLESFYPGAEEAAGRQFRYTAGRTPNEQEAFEHYVLGRIIRDIEMKMTGEIGMRYGATEGIKEALDASHAEMQNRVYTINPLAELGKELGKKGLKIQYDEHGKIIRTQEVIDAANDIARKSFGGGELAKDVRASLMKAGMNPDEYARRIVTGERLIDMHERGVQSLRNLLSEEGKKALKELFGQAFDPNKATINELQFVLYGGADLLRNRGFSSAEIRKFMDLAGDAEGLMARVDKRSGQVFWPGTNIELKPNPDHWKADMGRLWAFAPSDRESYALGQWVKNKMARTHEGALNLEIEKIVEGQRDYKMAQLTARGLTDAEALRVVTEAHSMETRDLWVRRELVKDMHNRLNSFAPEAYEVTGARINDLSTQVRALLANYLSKRDGGAEAHAETMEWLVRGFNARDEGHRDRLLSLLREHEKDFKAYMEKPVSYSDISSGRQVWVMLYEGGMVPYVKGMKVSDNDRIMGGYVAIKDQNGRWRKFDPNSARINLTEFSEKEITEKQKELEKLIENKRKALRANGAITEEDERQHATLLAKQQHGEALAAHEDELLARLKTKFDQKVLGDKEEGALDKLKQKLGLQMAWNAIAGEIDPRKVKMDALGNPLTWSDLDRGSFIAKTRAWREEVAQGTKEYYEREKVFNAVLWRYANVTHDWQSHWHESTIQVVPKRDTIPMAPQAWRIFTGKHDLDSMVALKPIRNFFLGVGDALSKISIASAGPILNASYAVTPFSEYYRLQSWRMAHDILHRRNWDEVLADIADPTERAKVRSLYEASALSHGAYHIVWDYAIDRNPWRHSTSYGAHQAWGSFFHFGPAEPFSVRHNLRPLYGGQMGGGAVGLGDLEGNRVQRFLAGFSQKFNRAASSAEWGIFNVQYGLPIRAARAAFIPFAAATRAFQMSIQGYPSRWDIKESPMKPWNYTNVRFGEAFRAMSPLASFTQFSLPFKIPIPPVGDLVGKIPLVGSALKSQIFDRFDGKKVDISEPWGSSLERSHLAGREFTAGLRQVPQDISFNRVGVFASARTGEANPGGSYYDYRAYLHLDPAMAEYLAYRSGEMSAYFRSQKYVAGQAHTGTIKRTVAAEAKAMRAEEELRGFGMLQNPLYSWFNPALFIWHSGLGFIPFLPSLSPHELLQSYAQRKQRGEKVTIKETAAKMASDFSEKLRMNWAPVGFNADIGLFKPKTWVNLFKPSTWKEATFAPGMRWRPGRSVFAASCPRCGTGGYLGTVCRGCSTLLYDADYRPGGRTIDKKWATSWSIWARRGRV